ncbi:MAG: leucine--tRNA ligase [bacterium]|nr:leucine--tRNA ligase [bacterium]
MQEYNPQQVEAKWAKIWEKKKAWKVDLKKAKKPYYNLMMFPYPSAEGLHVGNVYAFTGSDIYGRFKRAQGYDVFEPMGFDAFGIHSENFAIKKGVHPKTQNAKNIAHFRQQLESLGALFAWDHEVDTTRPEYYKWTQWIFLQLYKVGLAYKGKAPVEWCPSCKTVLANEQVINGKCERCDSQVIQKELEQWFFRITKYAERLLKNLEKIDWSERTKASQRNWIGKSEGVQFSYKVKDMDIHFEMFDSVPQTFMAQTFTVIAPEHPKLYELVKGTEHEKSVLEFVEAIKQKKAAQKFDIEKEARGIFTGRYIEYTPAKRLLPIWVASFVIADYGSGVVNASAHDERDFAFAKKYHLPLHPVMFPEDPIEAEKVKSLEYCYHHAVDGVLVEPAEFKGRNWSEVRGDIVDYIERNRWGKRVSQYHLRDWLISRQRYWGPPIPIIYCKKCGTVPVPEKDLPVLLPFVKNFRPEGTGKSPLASVPSFVKTKCPTCQGPAERETDVSDTFLDSAWYFLRYPCTDIKTKAFDADILKKWLPVNMYIGGQEHAVLHLLYTRFITMALNDLGFVEFEEPFKKFRAHGLITKEGAKMSKSKGNVENPDDYFKKYGADTVRLYLMFIGPFAEGGDWSDKGIVGMYRFLNRLWGFVERSQGSSEASLESLRHKTIQKVTEDLENLRYNTAIAALMEYLNESSRASKGSKKDAETLLILLAPFVPYITEELWKMLGSKDSVHGQPWPSFDQKLVAEKSFKLVLQVNGKVRDVIEVSIGISQKEVEKKALSSEKIIKTLQGKKPSKVIFVPNRLVNIVV